MKRLNTAPAIIFVRAAAGLLHCVVYDQQIGQCAVVKIQEHRRGQTTADQ